MRETMKKLEIRLFFVKFKPILFEFSSNFTNLTQKLIKYCLNSDKCGKIWSSEQTCWSTFFTTPILPVVVHIQSQCNKETNYYALLHPCLTRMKNLLISKCIYSNSIISLCIIFFLHNSIPIILLPWFFLGIALMAFPELH